MLVLPYVAASLVLETHWWAVHDTPVAVWTVGLSTLFGLVAWKLRSATAGAALAGAGIAANLMFSTTTVPYLPWRTAVVPVLAVMLLTAAATRLGKGQKERLGIAEDHHGRTATQVAANLGMAALLSGEFAQSWMINTRWFPETVLAPTAYFTVGLAALAEAAADTVSSELGQFLSDHPRMITTLRRARPGTDGAISLGGTLAGVVAAAVVSVSGAWALGGGFPMLWQSLAAAIFGLMVDSLLGATLEREHRLNNDLVNFLSTLSAAALAMVLLALAPQTGFGSILR